MRLLFVKVEADANWSEAEMDGVVTAIADVTPDDVRVFMSDDQIEYLSPDEALKFVETAAEAASKTEFESTQQETRVE